MAQPVDLPISVGLDRLGGSPPGCRFPPGLPASLRLDFEAGRQQALRGAVWLRSIGSPGRLPAPIERRIDVSA